MAAFVGGIFALVVAINVVQTRGLVSAAGLSPKFDAINPAKGLGKMFGAKAFFTVGKGQVVAYHETIGDPSEFGLDLIDLVTHRRRPARMWNALASIPLATLSPNPRALLLHAINYGSPVDAEVPARVLGSYASARLLRPGHAAAPMKVSKRGLMSEVALPRLDHLAVIEFLR